MTDPKPKGAPESEGWVVDPVEPGRIALLSLGEVMLRLDPGESRVHTARSFEAWEGGGEYNVARGLSSCFGHSVAHVTALVDNPVGRLVEHLMRAGGVDASRVIWTPFDGIGREARNALNFTERGFGARGAIGCSDRGHSATSSLRPGQVDWDALFRDLRPRWFHTGGIFAGLSDDTAAVAAEAMDSARRHGAVVSFDRNYRPSLWLGRGGRARAIEVASDLVPRADLLFGVDHEEATRIGGLDPSALDRDPDGVRETLDGVAASFPNLIGVATVLRAVRSASSNDVAGACLVRGSYHRSRVHRDVAVLDRVGSGDAFAAGLIDAALRGDGPGDAIERAAAHAVLTMTTPGDHSMATRPEVEHLAGGGDASVKR